MGTPVHERRNTSPCGARIRTELTLPEDKLAGLVVALAEVIDRGGGESTLRMSGSLPRNVTLDDALEGARRVAVALGVRPVREDLLAVASDQLVKAQTEGRNWLYADGDVLPQLVPDALRAGGRRTWR